MPNVRQQISMTELNEVFKSVIDKLVYRMEQKGCGTFASNFEILGIITQETSEYEEAIHKRVSDEAKIEELKDIAVTAIFGIASIKTKGIDF